MIPQSIRDGVMNARGRVYVISRCVDVDFLNSLRGLVRGGVDVRLIISDACDLHRPRLSLRWFIYLIVPVLIIAALLIPYSPYLAILIGFLGAVIAFAVISRQAAGALSSGWVRIVPSSSGFLSNELFVIDDEAYTMTSNGVLNQMPIDEAIKYFEDIWRTL